MKLNKIISHFCFQKELAILCIMLPASHGYQFYGKREAAFHGTSHLQIVQYVLYTWKRKIILHRHSIVVVRFLMFSIKEWTCWWIPKPFLHSRKSLQVKFISTGKERKTFNKYYQYFQKLIMNSLKQQISERDCQYEQKACLASRLSPLWT